MPTFRTVPVLAAVILVVSHSVATAQDAPRFAPSGRATSEITMVMPAGTPDSVAAHTVRIDYGQPHLRGRALHTDSLVPFDKVWRTGANATTTLTTDMALTIGGTTIPREITRSSRCRRPAHGSS